MNVETKSPKKQDNRTGREIKLSGEKISNLNPNVSFKIGTVENKNCPQTIFIGASFWVDLKNKNEDKNERDSDFDRAISKKYKKEVKDLYYMHLKPLLIDNPIFPLFYDNIYIYEFPENLNYNAKRSFTSIEINIHTKNCLIPKVEISVYDAMSEELKEKIKCPYLNLNIKAENDIENENNLLYTEAMKIVEKLANTDLLMNKVEEFRIYKTKN